MLLKWLGEEGETCPLRAAATISVPYDLAVASRYLERGVGRFYARHFMTRLKSKTLDLMERFPAETSVIDRKRLDAARTFGEFDSCVTAPLHGFASADDYYTRSSAVRYLSRIAVPTLCISSHDDPFFPAEAIGAAVTVASPRVTFDVTPKGGHVGFVAGRWPLRPVYWAEERATSWLGDPRPHATVITGEVAAPAL